MVSGASGQPRSVLLVEGVSDRIAVEVAAGILGRDLTAENLPVLPMGGSTNLRHLLEMLGHGPDVRVTVLGDEREARASSEGCDAWATTRPSRCAWETSRTS